MTEIGFYHLQRSSLNDALPKLLEKALQAGFRVLLKTPNAAETERLNLALWTYGQGSFLPHGTRTDGSNCST
jgi:DNA polymerase-3 subunit chi